MPRAGAKAFRTVDGKGRNGAVVRALEEDDALQTLEGPYLGARAGGPLGANAPPVAPGAAAVILTGQGGAADAARLLINVGAAASKGRGKRR